MKIIDFLLVPEVYLPIIYIICALLLYKLIKKVMKKALAVKIGKFNINKRRERTLLGLMSNIIKYALYFIAIILILNVYGVNTTAFLAGLGVVGLIIGLGVQDTIKDFLSGFFIILDNHYAIGDTVEIKGFVGEVIELGLKSTKIKSISGKIKCISNRNVTEVINYSIVSSTINLIIELNDIKGIDSKMLKILLTLENSDSINEVENMGLISETKYKINIKVKHSDIKEIKRSIYTEVPYALRKNKIDYKNIEVIYE